MKMMLVDTEAVIMHLIKQVKSGSIKNFQYVAGETYDKVEIKFDQELNKGWVAILIVDHEYGSEVPPSGSIRLECHGSNQLYIDGFFYRDRTPLLYEYARDFCKLIGQGYNTQTQSMLKAIVPDLEL